MFRPVLRNAVLLAALSLPLVGHAVQRSFVATHGNDGNTASNCPSTAPCRGFAAALSVTEPGGEIIVLRSGGYGPVSISQSVSNIAPEGVYAGISVIAGNGVTVSGANAEVTLRGLNINGLGGVTGISLTSGSSLIVENCTVTNMSAAGLWAGAPASVSIRNSRFTANGQQGAHFTGGASGSVTGSDFQANAGGGLLVTASGVGTLTKVVVIGTTAKENGSYNLDAQAHTSGAARLEVSDSVLSQSGVGIRAYSNGATARVSVANSLVSGNALVGMGASGAGASLVASGNLVTRNVVGLKAEEGGALESDSTNAVRGNGTETAGTITSFTRM